ncbi:LytTR family transcriptional regulator DNA-binding domain-containing protein [Clostridium sp. D2Q-11]|uniref:LytTR family transcriptional regulator DNA-binding domain-containing protein n=1 Tax=Anaeromonas frigoriresistens TaxID=2683708 RepID=A0A942UY55_9FIRM|nr:LytTR family transcriptional regulator DNA-binding domain-containing protein [Anaeromonas frigoriresistens]MBS4538969.1 LytTR family transcriptional regulator DNA-binding domain-containing protein [Anaeromonas frigoriresistens]
MLEIKNLYKEHQGIIFNHIDLSLSHGHALSIECTREASDMLIDLILGKHIPAKGEIHIEEKVNTEYIKKGLINIGIVLREEGYYERLTVKSYLKFYSELLDSQVNYKDIMRKLALLDIGHMKISTLSYSQKRRLSFARERLKRLKLLIFQEPILNMDRDGVRIVLENLEELRLEGVAILNTSVSLKETIILGGQSYILDEGGMKKVQTDDEEIERKYSNVDDKGETNIPKKDKYEKVDIDKIEMKPRYKIEKIPAKIGDKILLFNPTEIDYIESEQGISSLSVRGENFVCTFSLSELENRLKHFGFFRCHRSYLVNLQRVREIVTWTRNSFSLTLDDKNKSSIPLSKGRINDLKDILNL